MDSSRSSTIRKSESKLPDSPFKYNSNVNLNKFFTKNAFSSYPKGKNGPHPLEMISVWAELAQKMVSIDINKQIAVAIDGVLGDETKPVFELHLKREIQKLHRPLTEQKTVDLTTPERVYFYKQACYLLADQYEKIQNKIRIQHQTIKELRKNFYDMESELNNRGIIEKEDLESLVEDKPELVQLVNLMVKLKDGLMHLALFKKTTEEKDGVSKIEGSISVEKIQQYVDKDLFGELRNEETHNAANNQIKSYLAFLGERLKEALEKNSDLAILERHRSAIVDAMVSLRISTLSLRSRGVVAVGKDYGEALLREKAKDHLEAIESVAPASKKKGRELVEETMTILPDDAKTGNPDSIIQLYEHWFRGIYSSVLEVLAKYPLLSKTISEKKAESNLFSVKTKAAEDLIFSTEPLRKLVIEKNDEGFDLGAYIRYYEFSGKSIFISPAALTDQEIKDENTLYLTITGVGKERAVVFQSVSFNNKKPYRLPESKSLLAMLDEKQVKLPCILAPQTAKDLDLFIKITELCGRSQAYAVSKKNLSKIPLTDQEFFADALLSVPDQLIYINSLIQWFQYNSDFVNQKIANYREAVFASMYAESDALFRIPTEQKSLTWQKITDLSELNTYYQALIYDPECKLSAEQKRFLKIVVPFVDLYFNVTYLSCEISELITTFKYTDSGADAIEAALNNKGLFEKIKFFLECLANLEGAAIKLNDYLVQARDVNVLKLRTALQNLGSAISAYDQWLEPKCLRPAQKGVLGWGVFGTDSEALKLKHKELYYHFNAHRPQHLQKKLAQLNLKSVSFLKIQTEEEPVEQRSEQETVLPRISSMVTPSESMGSLADPIPVPVTPTQNLVATDSDVPAAPSIFDPEASATGLVPDAPPSDDSVDRPPTPPPSTEENSVQPPTSSSSDGGLLSEIKSVRLKPRSETPAPSHSPQEPTVLGGIIGNIQKIVNRREAINGDEDSEDTEEDDGYNEEPETEEEKRRKEQEKEASKQRKARRAERRALKKAALLEKATQGSPKALTQTPSTVTSDNSSVIGAITSGPDASTSVTVEPTIDVVVAGMPTDASRSTTAGAVSFFSTSSSSSTLLPKALHTSTASFVSPKLRSTSNPPVVTGSSSQPSSMTHAHSSSALSSSVPSTSTGVAATRAALMQRGFSLATPPLPALPQTTVPSTPTRRGALPPVPTSRSSSVSAVAALSVTTNPQTISGSSGGSSPGQFTEVIAPK